VKSKACWQGNRFGDKNASGISELKLPGWVVGPPHLQTAEAQEITVKSRDLANARFLKKLWSLSRMKKARPIAAQSGNQMQSCTRNSKTVPSEHAPDFEERIDLPHYANY
jgi:hypothetical protein